MPSDTTNNGEQSGSENCTHSPRNGITLYRGKRFRCADFNQLLECRGLHEPAREVTEEMERKYA